MSYQLRIFVFGHDFPRLEWKAGSIDTVRGPIFWGAKHFLGTHFLVGQQS